MTDQMTQLARELNEQDRKIHHDPRFRLQKHDVWGSYDHVERRRVDDGMVVARSGETCPVWGDVVPYKSATIVCAPEDESEVLHWIGYVQGGGPSRRRVLVDGMVVVALRSDYHAW